MADPGNRFQPKGDSTRGRPEIMILGIDESGRGPVIGDLVVGGVLLPSSDAGEFLAREGVRDSKVLSRKKREHLYPLIRDLSSGIYTRVISAKEVDDWRSAGGSLNELEAKAFAGIISAAHPDVAIVDCSDIVTTTFYSRLERYLGDEMPQNLVCEHFADSNYPVVAAASIIAKVTRDRRIGRLCDNYGEVGSGYCHDRRTLRFLEDWYDANGSFPDFVRKTWLTACRIREARLQRTLPVQPP